MTDHTRKPAGGSHSRPRWPSETQQANVKTNSAAANRARHHREPAEFDWDQAITRLKAMIDRIEDE